MTPIRLVIALTAALTLVIGLTGSVAAAGRPTLRFVNVVFPTSVVDLYIDGSLVFSDVKKGEVTDPVRLSTGNHLFKVTAAGDPNAEYASKTDKITAGAWTLVSWSPAGGMTLEPDATETVTGSALLRVWEFSYNLDLHNPHHGIAEGGTTLVPEISLPYPSAYLQFDPGAHTLKVIRTPNGATLFTFTVDLESDTNYTVFIYDVSGAPHAKLVVDASSVSNTALASRGRTDPLPLGLFLFGIMAAAITVGTSRIVGRSSA